MTLPYAGIKTYSYRAKSPLTLELQTTRTNRPPSAISEGGRTYQSVLLGTKSGIASRKWLLQREEFSVYDGRTKRIRVLENQSGYSYYDNYSSKPEGEVPEVPVVLEWYDYAYVSDTYSIEKTRLVEKYESVELRDRVDYRGGRTAYARADFAEMQEKFAERHGLWSFTLRDDISLTDRAERHGIWAVTGKLWLNWWGYGDWIEDLKNTQFKDQISFDDRGYINVERAYDSVGMYETYSQSGRRVQFASDSIGLFEKSGGNRDSVAYDQITLTESYLIQGRRVRLVADDISMIEGPAIQHGTRVYAASDQITLNEGVFSKHGLTNYRYRDEFGLAENTPPFLRTVRDELVFTEPAEQHGLRHWVYQDRYTVTDTLVNDTPVARETWLVDDGWYQQTGKRVYTYQDLILYADGGVLNTTTPVRQDTISLQEGVIRNGRVVLDTRSDLAVLTDSYKLSSYKTAVRTDSITLTERTEIHGKIQKRQNDLFTAQDYMVFNRPFQQDTYTLTEQYLPFRFDWRERLDVLDWHTIEKYKSRTAFEEIAVTDRGALNDKFVVDIIETEDLYLTESGVQSGTRVWIRTEQYSINENYYYPVNASPLIADAVQLLEQHKRSGKLVIPGGFTEEVVVTERYEIHGRQRKFANDAARMTESRNTPKSPLRRDDIYMQDKHFYVPTQYEYVFMKEAWSKEDLTQIITMQESYYLSNKEFTRREDLFMQELVDNKSGLDLTQIYTLVDSRLNERIMLNAQVETVSVQEKFKLFRKSDFLDIDPVIYTDRPARYRSAARLVLSPDKSLYAVWLDTASQTIQYVRKPYEDSWKTHSRTSIELPSSAYINKKSVALDFSGPEPAPAFESDNRIIVYRDNTWVELDMGVDVATHPTSGKLVYLTPDRLTVKTENGPSIALPRRGRLVQTFTGSHPGLYVVDDMNRLIQTIGTAPVKTRELEEEVASARWDIEYSKGWIPIEGSILPRRN